MGSSRAVRMAGISAEVQILSEYAYNMIKFAMNLVDTPIIIAAIKIKASCFFRIKRMEDI